MPHTSYLRITCIWNVTIKLLFLYELHVWKRYATLLLVLNRTLKFIQSFFKTEREDLGHKIVWDGVSVRVQYFLQVKSAFKNNQHNLNDLASPIEATAGILSERYKNIQWGAMLTVVNVRTISGGRYSIQPRSQRLFIGLLSLSDLWLL
jgi:hypothetical protein